MGIIKTVLLVGGSTAVGVFAGSKIADSVLKDKLKKAEDGPKKTAATIGIQAATTAVVYGVASAVF